MIEVEESEREVKMLKEKKKYGREAKNSCHLPVLLQNTDCMREKGRERRF